MQLKRVAVTGLGALTPLGNNVPDYWSSLKTGVSGASPITHFDASPFKTRFACEVKGFDPTHYIDRKEARKMDRFTQFAIACAEEAIQKSGFIEDGTDLERAGAIWSSGIGGIGTFEEEIMSYTDNNRQPRFNPFFIPKMIMDIAPGHISIRNGLKGVNFSTVSACASSTHALIDALNYIRLGKADVIVCGGSEAAITEGGVGGFNAMKALSQRNDDPQAASRPYDKNRDGFVLGEGGGALILEDYEHAKQRGATILAEVAGGGFSADAYHITAPDPEGHGAFKVMNEALSDAGLTTKDIDYINTHGTSTQLGDVVEINAIENVFGEHSYNLNISSTKSMTGHLLGAAGAIEAIASIMAVSNDTVPPTINNEEKEEKLDDRLNLTLNQSVTKPVNAALSNTFGFGGHNAAIIFKKPE